MIIVYLKNNWALPLQITADNSHLLSDAIWIDLFSPTKEEEHLIETFTHLEVPTREEMREIELSSRLYQKKDTLYMTVVMIAQSESLTPETDAVTFIVSNEYLMTVRYIEPQAFKLFSLRLKNMEVENIKPITLLTDFFDAAIDRLADIIEILTQKLDEYSNLIFKAEVNERNGKYDYQLLLKKLGKNGDLNTKIRECLISFIRLISFFNQAKNASLPEVYKLKLNAMFEDLKSLGEYINFLSTKINFLLDATLGMINIEQNNIIKIFSIAAVIFLPPTLIASIYGMNFKFMPELSWQFGYPVAILLLVISAWLPYKYFKLKKWL